MSGNMRRSRLFISQPMLNKSDEMIKAEREELVNRLKDRYEIIDSMIAETAPETSAQGAWYLGKAIQLLSQADYAYFMDGWQDARGSRIEHEVAKQYHIKIVND
jgi:hypothetical protein